MSHASSIEEINSTRRKINISVESSFVKEALNSVTNEMQSTAEIRGFRKGKAPLTIVRKFYMNDIVKKAADKVINEGYTSSIKNLDFQIVSQPEIEPVGQFSENEEFKFSATVDINPQVEIVNYKNISLKLPNHYDFDLEKQYAQLIENYQKMFREKEPEASIELNDEFAKRLGYENMEMARTKIIENIQLKNQEAKSNAAFDQIIDAILAGNDFEVAESLIESTIDRAIQDANTRQSQENHIDIKNADQRNNFREVALKNVRGILALGHIARQEGVTVTDEEVYRDLINFSMANQMDIRQLVKQGQKIIEEFRGHAVVTKVVNKLLDTAQIEYIVEEQPTKLSEVLAP